MATKRIRGVSVFRPIIYGNTTILLDPTNRTEMDHTHQWTIAVRSAASPAVPGRVAQDQIGGADDLSYYIKKVTFKLHDTYPTPLRTLEKPPFEVTETGWGEFDIQIKIFFVAEASEKPITFNHHLKLHPWPLDPLVPIVDPTLPTPGASPSSTSLVIPDAPTPILSPIHSWQYEEIVFAEPTEAFYTLLLSNAPTPLPPTNRHPRSLTLALGGGGNIGEFSMDMEKEEGDRLEKARLKTVEEIEVLRTKLLANEKDLTVLKKEVDELTAAALPR